MSLEIQGKLLTRCKFLKRDSSPGFFNSGMTTASFQQSGKIPDFNKLLIMLVITEISNSLQDFSKCVGMGSRQQEVDLEFAMSTRTSSSANSSKASIWVGGIVESLFTPLSSRTQHYHFENYSWLTSRPYVTSHAKTFLTVCRFCMDSHLYAVY